MENFKARSVLFLCSVPTFPGYPKVDELRRFPAVCADRPDDHNKDGPLFRRKCASERTGARLDIFNLKCSSPTSGFKKWESVFVELLISMKFAL